MVGEVRGPCVNVRRLAGTFPRSGVLMYRLAKLSVVFLCRLAGVCSAKSPLEDSADLRIFDSTTSRKTAGRFP